ncbi:MULTISPECIES: hypothetical protein [unclassified Streptomyces]|uniref:hypothetical protein n=1 Tax=unclassified Streptomyces TaxID=2593676 RepID=UPI0037F545CB
MIDTLLVSGLFVFALEDAAADDVACRLRRSGCRIIELPSSQKRRAGWNPCPQP